MAYASGDIIDKRYRIINKIGSGAHGVVYRARDLETRDEVALKFLGKGMGLDPEYNRRLEREAKAMAQLRGTSAVFIHALRLNDDLMTYIVMEMLHGQDFEKYMKSAEQRGGLLKVAKLLELMRPVIDTLEAAHAHNIVHRDLKPSNVFIVDREHGGGVRLLDFGLVKMLDDPNHLTGAGTVAGTPSYIAPEAWKGNPRALDHRIDVYAIGVMVFRALAGRVPFNYRGMADLLLWAQNGERPGLQQFRPKLPAAIDPWVQKAMAIEPDDRFQTVREMWNALESILVDEAKLKQPF